MFKIVILALAAWLGLGPLLSRPPDLSGLAIWYGPPAFREGDTMADGRPLRLAGATVAVDVSHHDQWLGRGALVLTECGGLRRVHIADTGKLYRVGRFRLGVRVGCLRYWPVGEPEVQELEMAERVLERPVLEPETQWLEGVSWPVVADFPQLYFAREVACRVDAWGNGDTTKVAIWILP